jgi:hypothetical protein
VTRDWDHEGNRLLGKVSSGSLQRAFRLAYFVCPDRTTAIDAVFQSMVRLDSVATAQTKRLYYRQARHAKIYRVSYNDAQLLQRLVFDSVERLVPRPLGLADTLVRYVACLLNQSMQRSSIYVAVAICRLLYRLSTQQTLAICDVVCDQPMTWYSEDGVRRAKQRLMEGLRRRFGRELAVHRDSNGELMFAGTKASDEAQQLIRATLEMFTPWDSSCDGHMKPDRGFPGLSDAWEIQCIHALIHPSCFERIASSANITGMHPWQPSFAASESLTPDQTCQARWSAEGPSEEDMASIIEQYERDRELHRARLG